VLERSALARLNAVEKAIRNRAERFAFGDPMLAEDLKQEARAAVFRQLQEVPDCPDSHLVREAKDAIYQYRRQGSSVDRLNLRERAKPYQLVGLEDATDETGNLSDEFISVHPNGQRPTEERVYTAVLFDELRERLTVEEADALDYRLEDPNTSWGEIGAILGKDQRGMGEIRRGLEENAVTIWELPEQYAVRPDREALPRARPLPDEIPPAVLDLLSEKGRLAIEALQRGATQGEAAQQAGLHRATVSDLVKFVWEWSEKPPEEIAERKALKRVRRTGKLLALFHSRPAGELIRNEELLEIFADLKDPQNSLWVAICTLNQELEGVRIVSVKGEGYRLVEEE
jgi:hypothetical protein